MQYHEYSKEFIGFTSPRYTEKFSNYSQELPHPSGLFSSFKGPILKLDLSIPNITEFISKLEEQVKRISPVFTLNCKSDYPLNQALTVYKQAVDSFLQRYSKNISALTESTSTEKLDPEFKTSGTDIEKTKETTKMLCKYERLLKRKEQNLAAEKDRIKENIQNMKIIEENLKQTRESFESDKVAWLEIKKNELEKIEGEKKKISADKKEIEKITESLRCIKEKYDKDFINTNDSVKERENSLTKIRVFIEQIRDELLEEKSRSSHDKFVLEQEKWKMSQQESRLTEQESLLELKFKHLSLEKSELEKESISLKQLRGRIEEERSELENQKREFLRELRKTSENEFKSSPDPNHDLNTSNISTRTSQFYDYKLQELDSREKELEIAYKDLSIQVAKFNAELEDRENFLEEKEKNIEIQNEELLKKIGELYLIEQSLLESRSQIEHFRALTIPEIEKQTKILQKTTSELLRKKTEVKDLVNMLVKEINLVKSYRGELDVIDEAKFESSSEENQDIDSEKYCQLAIEKLSDLENFIYKESEFRKSLQDISLNSELTKDS